MSRLELIAKVLQNFYRDRPEVEQVRWQERLANYIEDEAEHLAYQLKRAEIEEHLKQLGRLLFALHQAYAGEAEISAGKSYQHMSRLLLEQYDITVSSERTTIEVKPAKEISPASLQNPADDTATFRRKNGESYKGDLLNVAETCAPENPLQLLTDISVYPNMVADDVILTERIPEIKERTGVEEMVVDGGYSGEKAEKGHHIAHFAKEVCAQCPRRKSCLVRCGKNFYSLIYKDRQVLLSRRRQQLGEEAYRIKCRLRPAVEGTVSQFKRMLHKGKLRVRGLGRIRNSIILMAIGINFGRLWAYCQENKPGLAVLLGAFIILLMYLVLKQSKISRVLAINFG